MSLCDNIYAKSFSLILDAVLFQLRGRHPHSCSSWNVSLIFISLYVVKNDSVCALLITLFMSWYPIFEIAGSHATKFSKETNSVLLQL